MLSSRSRVIASAIALTMTPALAAVGQSSVVVSPFVSYVPSATANPLAGFALTFGGTTGLAFRSGAELSIENPPRDSLNAGGYRPWGADADAMLYLGGLGGGATVFQRALSPYLFIGLGITGGDSAGHNIVRQGWSYGVGASLPLGLDADLFAEARWRMPEYVLPTSRDAPDSKSAFRFGISFLVGGGSQARPAPRPRRGHRMEAAQYDDADEEAVEYVVTQPAAPAPQVVVVQPAPQPAPAPQVVVIERESPRQVISPVIVFGGSSRRSRRHVAPPVVRVTPSHGSLQPLARPTVLRTTKPTTTRATGGSTVLRRVTSPVRKPASQPQQTKTQQRTTRSKRGGGA